MMPSRLVLSERGLEEALRLLRRDAVAFGEIGICRHGGGADWLLRRVRPMATWDGREAGIVFTTSPTLQGLGVVPTAVVVLPREGRPSVHLVHPDGYREPLILRLIAPGLPEIGSPPGAGACDPHRTRSAGALGESVWRRLHELHYALVGCGRTGSLVAHTLVRTGAVKLTLVDPDRVEAHNLDGDGMLPDYVGRPKADALAESLSAINPSVDLHPLVRSVTEAEVLPWLKSADVLICAVDQDGARWACGVLAALYLKPLLDIGTGVLGVGEAEPVIGADLRWIVPGEHCLLCMGGVARPEHVVVVREGVARERMHRQGRRWRDERRGSLRSLNQIAVGLALRMLEDYLAARLSGSLWMRLSYNGAVPEIRSLPSGAPDARCLCPFSGGGDQILARPDAVAVTVGPLPHI
jgi:predicted ThiF/HesA family dinucleotide-utilizing enzyme